MRPLLILGLTGALLAGCGGDGGDDAVEVARAWVEAVAAGEHERACELMDQDAVAGLKVKVGLPKSANCVGAVRTYAGAVGRGDLDEVLDVGLEAEGPVKKDQVGVFPQSGPRELEVILMRRSGGDWKVASMSLGLR